MFVLYLAREGIAPQACFKTADHLLPLFFDTTRRAQLGEATAREAILRADLVVARQATAEAEQATAAAEARSSAAVLASGQTHAAALAEALEAAAEAHADEVKRMADAQTTIVASLKRTSDAAIDRLQTDHEAAQTTIAE